MNSEIFFNLSTDKISIIVFDKDKKEDIYNKTQNFDKSLSKDIFIKKNLNSTLEKQILYIEKIIGRSLNKINLMIDDSSDLVITASSKKNYDKKPVQKSQIEYLIQDLKQQIQKSNQELKILHIVVNNFILDGDIFKEIPLNKFCNNLVVEVKFICIKKNLISFIEDIFSRYQIEIRSIISTKYAKSLVANYTINIQEARSMILSGSNYNEVLVSPKKTGKLGFFERIFHLLS